MKKFEFSPKNNSNEVNNIFNGDVFYSVFKHAEFLEHTENIEIILSKGYELRKALKEVANGEKVTVTGMFHTMNTPLVVKKTGANVEVKNFEFTANRLTGLTAAYAFDNRSQFPDLKSSEAETLGLTWDNKHKKKCMLYLSAVSGTEHFVKQFKFWPLVCGLKKLQLKKITIEPITKMAKIKNQDGVTMAEYLMKNLADVTSVWASFPGGSNANFGKYLKSLPLELQNMFFFHVK